MATVPGTAVPWPYGGKQRQVSVNVDIPSLQAKGFRRSTSSTPSASQNLALPSGTVKLGPTEYNVEMNGSTDTIAALNDLPIKTANGATIYVRDVATVSDGFSPQTNIVRMDGQRGVLVTIYKTGNASTLDIVEADLRQASADRVHPAAAAGDHAALRPVHFRARRGAGRDSRRLDRRLPHRR